MIYHTCREYQSALSDFMVATQSYDLVVDGQKQRKVKIFDMVWENHTFISPETPFDITKDTLCQLILAGNHPEIHIAKRDYAAFNENEMIKNAVRAIMVGRAAPALRAATDPDNMLDVVTDILVQSYFDHQAIDKQVDAMMPKQV